MATFRKLNVWQRARQLTRDIYRETRAFPAEEQFGLSAQLRRAAVSIMCNLAEGCARSGRRDQLRLLNIAYASAAETECLLVAAGDQAILAETSSAELIAAAIEIQRMLAGLMRALRAP